MNRKEQWTDVIYHLFKWRLYIVISTVLITIAVFAYSKAQRIRYESVISCLVLSGTQKESSTGGFINVPIFMELATSPAVTARLREGARAGSGGSLPREFKLFAEGGMSTVASSTVSPIVRLKMQSVNYELLQKATEAWAKVLLEYVGEIKYSVESDRQLHLNKKLAYLRSQVDSLNEVERTANARQHLDARGKNLAALQQALFTDIEKRQMVTNEITHVSLSKRSNDAIITGGSAQSDATIDETMLSDNEKKATRTKNRAELSTTLLKDQFDRVKRCITILAGYDHQRQLLASRIEILDSILSTTPKRMSETRTYQDGAASAVPMVVKTDAVDPLYERYKGERADKWTELQNLDREYADAVTYYSVYKSRIDSLSIVVKTDFDNAGKIYNRLNAQAARDSLNTAMADSLNLLNERLRVNNTGRQHYLASLNEKIAESEARYFALSLEYGKEIASLEIVKDTRDRFQKQYVSLTDLLASQDVDASSAPASVRLISSASKPEIIGKNMAARNALIAFAVLILFWFGFAMMVVSLKPDFATVATRLKVDRLVVDVEKKEEII